VSGQVRSGLDQGWLSEQMTSSWSNKCEWVGASWVSELDEFELDGKEFPLQLQHIP
jgi:hypothetical protein